ncbi:MAG: glycosyltransferase [Bacilli bacterium]|nr:glycosyltransferase [Bacilli bacterium]
MKKISILSLHLGYGGIEKSIVSLANMLCNNYEVEIACSYMLYDNPAFSIDSRVKIKYLVGDKKPNREEFFKSLKHFNYFQAIKEGIYGLETLYLRKKTMIKYITDGDYDIIISSRDIFNELVSKYASDKVLKIGWEHNHYHGDLKYADKIVSSVRNFDYLVLVSKELEKFYNSRMKLAKCKCIYIPNVIEDIPDDTSDLKAKKMISVGRLSLEKGFMDLLKIFKEIAKEDSEWTLEIIGDGDERGRLEKYICDNGLSDRVSLSGFKDKEYIYDALKKSSIYLMTSYTESFGIVLLEAMSCGVPCVAFSSAEGATEIIEDGKNGYLIDNRNFYKYIDKVKLLMDNFDVRVKLGKEAYYGVGKYSSDTVATDWLNLLEKM